ncbi:MAG: glycoside hydrolase family 44 protein [Thermoplasmata archaeon]|nr:glycoside hydrolase family 44 protein [Thermoplasmata archaeon]
MSRSNRSLAGTWGLPLGIVLILLLSGNAAAYGTPPAPAAGPGSGHLSGVGMIPTALAGPAPITVPLTVSTSSVNLSSLFWGTTVNNEVRMFRGETPAVNATPARVLVWPGAMAGEDYNPLTNIHYNTYNGTPTRALTNESQFVQMCRATHCTAVVQVPAEIDDPAFAAKVVNYTEVNLSFHPAYWMIGNEPELWGHWQVAWKDWPTTYTNGPDPTQFGNEVVAYVKAIRAIDNTTPILGLPASGCTCGYWTFAQWISGVLNVTGPKIQAVAFHEYPAGWLGTGDGSLHDFYGTIQSDAGIPIRMVAARHAVVSSCPKCNVSVWISELGSALSWSAYGQYAFGFSGPLSLASQITQAMDDNLTNVDLFAAELATSNSWFGTAGHARPDYALYTQIFDHLGTQAFQVKLPGLDHTLYATDTLAPNDQGRRDLLVVNDNITHAISFSPQFAGVPVSTAVAAWSWNGSIHYDAGNFTTWVEPYTPNPVPLQYPGGLPGNFTLPPQSMVLFEAYPSGGTYVQVRESGVPSPTAWYASVGARFYTTTADNVSILLPPNSYPVASVGIPLPLNGTERTPSERLGPFAETPLPVSGAYVNTTIRFVDQWRVNVTASPGDGGTIRPAVDWWNASQPLNVTVTPKPGWAFVGWTGWGPGNASGPNRTITVVPTGRLVEKARFVVGDEVVFLESGLPVGTPWSVTVRAFGTNSSTNNLTLYEAPGRYGFTLSSFPGYRNIPENGAFTAAAGGTLVRVRYVPITPPQPTFPVTFRATGLPAGTPVTITVRSSTQSVWGSYYPRFPLINGTYSYDVGFVGGYHANVSLKIFHVAGGPLTITVPFVRTMYPVTWAANGTREGLNWSVQLDGLPMVATASWISAALPNGSYYYAVELPANYSASPRTGDFVVGGAAMRFPLVFQLLEFRASFEATGPAPFGAWSVRLGSTTQNASANRSSFVAPNGTYTFDVHAPTGFFATPSHGNLTIAGLSPPIVIRFDLTSDKPSAALVAALSTGALWASCWIGASIFVGFAALRALRRRNG